MLKGCQPARRTVIGLDLQHDGPDLAAFQERPHAGQDVLLVALDVHLDERDGRGAHEVRQCHHGHLETLAGDVRTQCRVHRVPGAHREAPAAGGFADSACMNRDLRQSFELAQPAEGRRGRLDGMDDTTGAYESREQGRVDADIGSDVHADASRGDEARRDGSFESLVMTSIQAQLGDALAAACEQRNVRVRGAPRRRIRRGLQPIHDRPQALGANHPRVGESVQSAMPCRTGQQPCHCLCRLLSTAARSADGVASAFGRRRHNGILRICWRP